MCYVWAEPKQLVSHQSAFFSALNILASRIFSNNLRIVPKRLLGREEEGSAGSFPGLRTEITRNFFHVRGK